ncbi:DUF898 family protein [Shimia sp.]|uniref:DUF898 family protein n=1 Tax=Shimia sp. TaxID=1954381 RepID=UPI0035613F6B
MIGRNDLHGAERTGPDPETAGGAPPEAAALPGDFVGRRRTLLWLALRTGALTVLTLGLYRFWMKTRLRRWYWSSVRIGRIPAEYVGDPFEKLLGFLIAVVFLAFYIGIVNLVLMFLSFSLFKGNAAAYLLSLIGIVPLWFYASYRARRYVLARTRWRGIRFGLEPGAWGYAWRAVLHWALTLLTLGLLWPRMRFWLEKYHTDRTWYGDLRLEQGGSWTMLLRPLLQVLAPLLLLAAGGVAMAAGLAPPPLLALPLLLWAGYGLAACKTLAFARLTEAKRAGGIGFEPRPRVWRVFWIYVLGYGLAGLVASVFLIPVSIVLVVAFGMAGELGLDLAALEQLPRGLLVLVGSLAYFSLFLVWSALRHAFVTMPLWRHFAETLTLRDPGRLCLVAQRPRDAFAEAEGFAEALDVGAAI